MLKGCWKCGVLIGKVLPSSHSRILGIYFGQVLATPFLPTGLGVPSNFNLLDAQLLAFLWSETQALLNCQISDLTEKVGGKPLGFSWITDFYGYELLQTTPTASRNQVGSDWTCNRCKPCREGALRHLQPLTRLAMMSGTMWLAGSSLPVFWWASVHSLGAELGQAAQCQLNKEEMCVLRSISRSFLVILANFFF